VVCTGSGRGRSTSDARKIAVEGLREAARVAADCGTSLSIEPIREYDDGSDYSIVRTLPETVELIEEIGADNVGIAYDVYHVFDTPDAVEWTERVADRVAAAHVCDYRTPQSSADRVLPGDGIIDLGALFGALEAGGFDGWYDLEIFSDKELADSLWLLDPKLLLERGRAAFFEAWESRTPNRRVESA